MVANLPHFIYECAGYHMLACDWRAEKLPHTSITSSQCYRAGSNCGVSRSGSAALGLSEDNHQDLH